MNVSRRLLITIDGPAGLGKAPFPRVGQTIGVCLFRYRSLISSFSLENSTTTGRSTGSIRLATLFIQDLRSLITHGEQVSIQIDGQMIEPSFANPRKSTNWLQVLSCHTSGAGLVVAYSNEGLRRLGEWLRRGDMGTRVSQADLKFFLMLFIRAG